MDKQAYLEDVYEACFNDELEKIAGKGESIGKAIDSGLATWLKSFKRLGKGTKAAGRQTKRVYNPKGSMGSWSGGKGSRSGGLMQEDMTRTEALQRLGQSLKGTVSNSKAALATIGAGGFAAGGGGYMALRKKK